MIIVDTNMIGYLFLNSPHSLQAEQALRSDAHWAAPLLWRSELRNVLAFQVRQKVLKLEDAQAIMQQAEQLMQGSEYTVVSSRVLQLAAESGCTAYDCEFVALAQDLGAPLVTFDRQVLEKFPQTAIRVETFLG